MDIAEKSFSSKKQLIEKKIVRASVLLNTIAVAMLCAVAVAGALVISSQRSPLTIAIFVVVLAAVSVFILVRTAHNARTISTRICQPLNQLTDMAAQLAEGRLDTATEVLTGDEAELLSEALHRMAKTLQGVAKDTQTMLDAVTRGDLDTRIDASAYHGAFAEMANGLNRMAQAQKEPLECLLPFAENMANGVWQDDVENVYQGIYAQMTDQLNGVRHALGTILTETKKLGEAGKNGDLETRGDVSALKGVYAETVQNFNEAFEGLQTSMDDVIGRLNGIRDGRTDLSTDNPYKGYPGRMVESLNVMYSSLYHMVMESQRISEAALKGDLTVRGDISKLSGGQVSIVQGFNDTLDHIIEPIEQMREVLRAIAQYDFSVEIDPEQFLGSMQELATDVAAVLVAFRDVEKVYVALASGNIKETLENVRELGQRSKKDRITLLCIRAFETIVQLIDESDKMAQAAREGNLSVRADAEKFKGAFRQILEGLNSTMEAFSDPMDEVVRALNALAGGDLTFEANVNFHGRYGEMLTVINVTSASLRDLVQGIATSSEEVTAGAGQIADASQSLSQGSTEQASSVEQLTASLSDVAAKTRESAKEAAAASDLALTQKETVDAGSGKMRQMLSAMGEIDQASANIAKIIKVIDDIAFQTNILALNAAVEAARAGQYGKGFAVVAEEVRNLAAKSAEAAKNTSELIGNSIDKVRTGTGLAHETAEMLTKISESVRQSTQMLQTIGQASNEQSTAIAEINQGIQQVSQVVQTNSATAEESAASSEELSGQSASLMQLVRKFRLK